MIMLAISGFITNTLMATMREHSPSRRISTGIASRPRSRTVFCISSSPRRRPRKHERLSSNPGDEEETRRRTVPRRLGLPTGSAPWLLRLAVGLAAVALAGPLLAASGVEGIWLQTHWGESSDALLREFGADAKRLPRALDFGDSYVDVALPDQTIGGVPMVVFFQMDKVSHGLAHPARAAAPRRQPTRLPRDTVGAADGLWQPGPALRDPRTSGERVSGSGRSAVASGRRRRQRDLSRHDPPSL